MKQHRVTKRLRIWGSVLFTVLVLALAGFLWQLNYTRNFKACVAGGEDIRTALHAFQQAHGKYPTRLDELPPFAPDSAALDCAAWKHLSYSSSTDGLRYRLQYEDILTGWMGTEDHEFMAYML